jgi:hypothetical protein
MYLQASVLNGEMCISVKKPSLVAEIDHLLFPADLGHLLRTLCERVRQHVRRLRSIAQLTCALNGKWWRQLHTVTELLPLSHCGCTALALSLCTPSNLFSRASTI